MDARRKRGLEAARSGLAAPGAGLRLVDSTAGNVGAIGELDAGTVAVSVHDQPARLLVDLRRTGDAHHHLSDLDLPGIGLDVRNHQIVTGPVFLDVGDGLPVQENLVRILVSAGQHRGDLAQRGKRELDDLFNPTVLVDDPTIGPDLLFPRAKLAIDEADERRWRWLIGHDARMLPLRRLDNKRFRRRGVALFQDAHEFGDGGDLRHQPFTTMFKRTSTSSRRIISGLPTIFDATAMVVIDGKPSKIVGKPEPIRLNDVLVRINMVVKG